MRRKVYEINRPMVSAENFDNETIIIHFDTGNYYSLDSFSSIVWLAAEQQADMATLPEILTGYFQPASPAKLRVLVKQLVSELLREDLIRPVQCNSPGKVELPPDGNLCELPENAGQLTKFDDLQELLLLDPIHDVDEAGWPHAR